MDIFERQQRDTHPAPAGPAAADRTALRSDAERLLAAADEAIERALSTDSAAFLRANRQLGGQ